MGKQAKARGINVIEGIAEDLPVADSSYNFALMVTTICFLHDLKKAFHEAHRIIKPNGSIILGFIDKTSPLGKIYRKYSDKSVFYSHAVFYSAAEVLKKLLTCGFKDFSFYQTLFKPLDQINKIEAVRQGYGEGSFVVITAKK